MENASKFLIMAASILIALMLIGIFTYVFRAGARVDEQYDLKQSKNQLELYNSRFENYNVHDNTIMDLITVANLAYDVNTMTDYDDSSSVLIEIVIGSKTFTIPEKKDASNIPKLKKNQILDGDNKPISIYNLADKTIGELNATGTGFAEDDKLTKTYLGNITYKDENNNDISKIATVYKYIWNCEKIEYHDLTGRVSKIRFVRYKPNSGEELFWNPNWDK